MSRVNIGSSTFPMSQRLEIFLDGPSEHLGDNTKGVSVDFFAEYAKKLRKAYRRTAQSILVGEIQDSGRLNNRAKEVDIRIIRVKAGSLDSSYIAVDNGFSPELHIGLSGETLKAFCESIYDASKGKPAPAYIERLLTGIPDNISQRFRHFINDQIMSEITVNSGMIDLPEDIVPVATVRRMACTVRGVAWEPVPTVLLRDENNKKHSIPSTERLLEKAISLRSKSGVVATIVSNKKGVRLIGLITSKERKDLPDPPTIVQTLERFENVHAELAK